MKLGDGRKVTMHKTPACAERSRFQTETSRLLAEWLRSMDEVKMTRKSDPSYARKVEEMKDAKAKFKAADSHLQQHLIAHRCW
jgi:hypothetical protein